MTTPSTTTGIDFGALPPVLSIEQAGAIVLLGRSQAYAAAARGDIPTVRIGERKLVVPTAALIRKFNLDGASVV